MIHLNSSSQFWVGENFGKDERHHCAVYLCLAIQLQENKRLRAKIRWYEGPHTPPSKDQSEQEKSSAAHGGEVDEKPPTEGGAPCGVVSGLSAGRATDSRGLFVVLDPVGRGRLLLLRLVLARRCMWSFVPSDLGSEALVLFTELLIFLPQVLRSPAQVHQRGFRGQ